MSDTQNAAGYPWYLPSEATNMEGKMTRQYGGCKKRFNPSPSLKSVPESPFHRNDILKT